MKLTSFLALSLLLFSAVLAKADSADKNALLIQAVKNGKTTVVQTLLKQGADPNVIEITSGNDTGFSALLWGAFDGRIDIVRLLLDEGADVNAKPSNLSGMTALMGASA